MSGGSITYGGSETMSSSRGTVLCGDGSGGVIGYGSRGSRNDVQPLAATTTAASKKARTAVKCEESVRASLDSRPMSWLARRRGRAATLHRTNRHNLCNRKISPATLGIGGKHQPFFPS